MLSDLHEWLQENSKVFWCTYKTGNSCLKCICSRLSYVSWLFSNFALKKYRKQILIHFLYFWIINNVQQFSVLKGEILSMWISHNSVLIYIATYCSLKMGIIDALQKHLQRKSHPAVLPFSPIFLPCTPCRLTSLSLFNSFTWCPPPAHIPRYWWVGESDGQ